MSEQKPKSKITPIALLVLLSMILGTCAWIFNEGSKSAKRAEQIEASRQAKRQARLAESKDDSPINPAMSEPDPALCDAINGQIRKSFAETGWPVTALILDKCANHDIREDGDKRIVNGKYSTRIGRVRMSMMLEKTGDRYRVCSYLTAGEIEKNVEGCN